MKVATCQKRLPKSAAVEVVGAKRESGYKLKIRFSDGASRKVDFGPFLKSSANPLIRQFLDRKKFGGFTVRDGDLMWGDYQMIFPIADLFEGRI